MPKDAMSRPLARVRIEQRSRLACRGEPLVATVAVLLHLLILFALVGCAHPARLEHRKAILSDLHIVTVLGAKRESEQRWISLVELSPNRKYALLAEFEGSAEVWNLEENRLLRTISPHLSKVRADAGGPTRITAAAFSIDSELLVTGGEHSNQIVREVKSGRQVYSLHAICGNLASATFLADGSLLLASDGCKRPLWCRQNFKIVHPGESEADVKLDDPGVRMGSLIPAPDKPAAYFIADPGTADSAIWCSDLSTGLLRHVVKLPGITCLSISCEGRNLAVGGSRPGVTIIEASSGRIVREFDRTRRPIRQTAFSPDGMLLLSLDREGAVDLWECSSGRHVREVARMETAIKVEFSAGGRNFLVARTDGTICVLRDVPKPSSDRPVDGKDSLELESVDYESWAVKREALLAASQRTLDAIRAMYSLDRCARLTEQSLDDELNRLDDEDPMVREKSKKRLAALGCGILPLIRKAIQPPCPLSPQVQSSLNEILRRIQSTRRVVKFGNLGRIRTVMLLLEMERSSAVQELLEVFAGGAADDYASELARRGLGW
jgi:hypothetical protein